MIGVWIRDGEREVVDEFFQLFKTPWEIYDSKHSYDIVVSTRYEIPENLSARVVVVYNAAAVELDREIGVTVLSSWTGGRIECGDIQPLPIYGEFAVLEFGGRPLLTCAETLQTVGGIFEQSEYNVVRIGFDLFSEAAILLSRGQPKENACIPALDGHIEILRGIMVAFGVSFVEIGAAPAGYDFITCLTHDVDFIGIRDHKFDRTMWGFLYRCFVGSLTRVLTGRLSWSKCIVNWKAGFSLPLVFLGLKSDFWIEFERYMAMEKDLGSTFFFIPFRNVPGTLRSGPAPSHRAAKYDIAAISAQLAVLIRNGCEIGVHGIDAWQNLQQANLELSRIRDLSQEPNLGIRMHWLYCDENSPKILEQAGYIYDSSCGYNDALGFRTGTSQVFRPLGASRLLELPLNIQDTALFYSDRMNLSEPEALDACKGLLQSMRRGGALTINWHTRSLSPERLWGDFYAQLLSEIRTHRAWFTTAQEAVYWFRTRRAVSFESVASENGNVTVRLKGDSQPINVPFSVRLHRGNRESPSLEPISVMSKYTEICWNGEAPLDVSLENSTQCHNNRLSQIN